MTGVGQLVRFALRRDRWHLLWWSLGVGVLFYSQAVSVDGLYTTRADYERAAATIGANPALLALSGPPRALDTLGGQVAWQSTAFAAVIVGLMSMILVGRHTRAEEETGRDELVRSCPVSRTAHLVAAVLHSMLVNVVVGVVVVLSLLAYDLAVADSVALGVGVALVGWLFTGTAALAAQLTSTTRAMYGAVGALIGLAYVLRAVGDVGGTWPRWLSPIGWYQAMNAYAGLRWWPALLLLAGAAAGVAGALAAFARRDYGMGTIAPRPGPARARPWLGTGWGLAWYLQRPALIGWTAGLLLIGLAFGSMGDQVGDLVGDSEMSRDLIGFDSAAMLVDAFYATAVSMMAAITTGFVVSSALRPWAEEQGGHAEVVLATALPRSRWLLAHGVVTALGTAVVILAGGLGLGVGYWLTTGDGAAVGRYVGAATSQVPGVLVVAGVARALYGLVPRWAMAAWVLPGIVAVVLFFGDLLDLPEWLRALSPLHHLARVPLEDVSWSAVLGLALVAAALSAIGQLGFRRRDLRLH